MIIEIELAVLLALELARLLAERTAFYGLPEADEEPSSPAPHAEPASTLQIVKRVGAAWVHAGHRHADHSDVAEALSTPGLAVRHADGSLEEGK